MASRILKKIILFLLIFLGLISDSYEVIFPKYGGNLNINVSSLPVILDPIWQMQFEEEEIERLIYDPLCELNEDDEVIMLLLSSAEMVGNIWYFELKQDIEYYPFRSYLSSYDVKNSLLYCKNELNLYSYLLSNIELIEVIDANKFFVKLKKVDQNFLKKLCHPAFSIVRRWKNELGNESIAGIGSYYVKEESLPNSIVLVSNEYYYGGRAFIDRINISLYDKVNPVFKYKMGFVHILSLWGGKILNIEKVISLDKLIKAKKPLLVFCILNPLKGLTKSEDFREWFASKLDSTDILRNMFDNRGDIIFSLFSGNNNDIKIKSNMKLKEIKSDERSISMLVLNRDYVSIKMAERIQAILIREGYEVQIMNKEIKDFFKQQDEGSYDIIVSTMVPYYKDINLNVEVLASIFSHIRKCTENELDNFPDGLESYLIKKRLLIPLISLHREYAINDEIQFYFTDFNSISDLKDAWLR